jgi:hypothetical protein
MFFRRERPKALTLTDRVELLKQAGFTAQTQSDGRVKVTKNGVGFLIGDAGKNQLEIDKAGILIGDEIAVLLSG